MKTLLLDTHVLQWWSAEPHRLSRSAAAAIDDAAELAVASISWFELAWLAEHQRILTSVPVRSWLSQLHDLVRSVVISPAVAATAANLPADFPGDPADRLIYATALEHGWQLVTKDQRLRRHPQPRPITVW
ncbi:MAG: type II toxin-antitoxin system VapC family toxin [Candidatus Dormibacteria bacterium]